MSGRKRSKASVWDRARVGGRPLFHDPELQRAYWRTMPVFDDIRHRAYVATVFERAARNAETEKGA